VAQIQSDLALRNAGNRMAADAGAAPETCNPASAGEPFDGVAGAARCDPPTAGTWSPTHEHTESHIGVEAPQNSAIGPSTRRSSPRGRRSDWCVLDEIPFASQPRTQKLWITSADVIFDLNRRPYR